MKTKPLKTYLKPDYPELNRENEASVKLLLRKRMPAHWKRLAASAAMLCATAGLVDGCTPDAAEVEWVDEVPGKDGAAKPKNAITVAPLSPVIFEHAKASFGCVAVTLPVYLSEDEAAEIIFDELGKRGIHLKPKLELSRKPLPPRKQSKDELAYPPHLTKAQAFAEPAKPRETLSLELDWFDAEKGVAIEFMSSTDEWFWRDVALNRENPSDSFRFDSFDWHDYGISAPAFAEVIPFFEGERPWKVGLFTPSFIYLTKEEDQIAASFYEAYHEKLNAAIPEVSLFELDYQKASDERRKKIEEFAQANKEMREEARGRYRAYLKQIGKTGESELRAQVKHFVKWLETHENQTAENLP